MKKASYKNILDRQVELAGQAELVGRSELVGRTELVGQVELAGVQRKRSVKIEQVMLQVLELTLHKALDYIDIQDYYLTH